jgi:hypothetical protein
MPLALLLIALGYLKKQELVELPFNKGLDYLNSSFNYIVKH